MNSIKINPADLKPVKCECGGEIFEIVYYLRHVPAVLTGASIPQIMQIPIYKCLDCGKILSYGKESISKEHN